MNKTDLRLRLKENYSNFVSYIATLSPKNYDLAINGKWSAGEHLAHLVLSVEPLVQVFRMEKDMMIAKFGHSEGHKRSYEDMQAFYFEKLAMGGIAPKRFDPRFQSPERRAFLGEKLVGLIEELCSLIDNFAEEDLDHLALPHPMLGTLSLREMLYNAIYHAVHHQNLASKALDSIGQ